MYDVDNIECLSTYYVYEKHKIGTRLSKGFILQIISTSNPLTYNTTTPFTVFRVRQGYRYRFRCSMLSTCVCSIEARFEKHEVTLIALDGSPCDPTVVRSMSLNSGTLINYEFSVYLYYVF